MAVSMYGIMMHFAEYPKAVRRGEIAVKSNHVLQIQYDPEFGKIMGQVKASQRSEKYKIEKNRTVDIDTKGLYNYDISSSFVRNLQQVNAVSGTEPSSPYPHDVDHFLTSQREVQRQRKAALQKACKKYRSHYYPQSKYGVQAPSRFIVNKEHKLIYCSVAKVASTNWRLVFEQLAGTVKLGQKVTQKQINSILKRDLTFMNGFTPKMFEKMKAGESLSFMFARHPFSRVLSAYKNKLDPNTTFPRADHWQRGLGRKIVMKYRPNDWDNRRSFEANYDLTFSDFVRFLGDEANARDGLYNNIHWVELESQCSPCSFDFDVIGKLETLNDDVKYILQLTNLEGQVDFQSSESSSPTHSSKSLDSYLESVPGKSIRNLYKRYKLDFDLFGYELPESAVRKMEEDGIHV